MSKPVLRVILSAAAVVFTLNLLFFNYSQFVLLPLLGALFLLAALIGLGDGLATLFRIRATGILEKAALGLMAAAAYFYLVSFFKILNPWTVLTFFSAALAVFIWRFWAGRDKLAGRAAVKSFFSRPLSEYAVFLIPLVYAALPPSFYDSLVYHLGIPNLYLQSGGFVATPQFVYANTFIYYEISLIPAVFLGNMVPRLFHFLLGALFVLAAADEAVEHWGLKHKINLILALVSLPMTLFLLVTCKNDLIGAIFIFIAITRFQRGDWKLSAVFWGFAIGIKYFNLMPLVVCMLVVFKPWRKTDLKKLVFTGLIVLLAVSPLLLKNFIFNGNPFSPFLADKFPSPYWDSGRYAYLQADVGRMYGSLRQFLKFPYELSFSERGSGGIVGPLFIIFLPFLILAPAFKKKWLVFSLLALSATPFLSGSLRFAYIAFVFLTIYCLYAFEASATRFLKCIFYLLLAVNFFMGTALLERVYAAHWLWSGKFTPEEYKANRFPAYPVFAYINANTPARAKILLAGEARNFYLRRPYRLSSALDYCVLNPYLGQSRNAGEFIAAIKKDGFSYLLVNFSELERLQAGYGNMDAAEYRKLLGFLRSLTPVFRNGSVCLYPVPG